jgi:hypothetical protein
MAAAGPSIRVIVADIADIRPDIGRMRAQRIAG